MVMVTEDLDIVFITRRSSINQTNDVVQFGPDLHTSVNTFAHRSALQDVWPKAIDVVRTVSA